MTFFQFRGNLKLPSKLENMYQWEILLLKYKTSIPIIRVFFLIKKIEFKKIIKIVILKK